MVWKGIDFSTALPYDRLLRTVAETHIFTRYAGEIWTPDEHHAFVNWIAANPFAGDLIRGSGGCRKVRWSLSGQGKRGGVRVIFFNPDAHTIWLLIVYRKASFDNLPASFLAELRKEVLDAD